MTNIPLPSTAKRSGSLWTGVCTLLFFFVFLTATEVCLLAFRLPSSELETWRTAHVDQSYDVALTGNSMTTANIDTTQLGDLLHLRVLDIAHNASDSAYWYLAVKNQLLSLREKPATLILTFRSTELTRPANGISGQSRINILSISEASEPLVDRFSFDPQMNVLEFWMFRYVRAYRAKEELANVLYEGAALLTALVTGQSLDAVHAFTDRAFQKKNIHVGDIAAMEETWFDDSFNLPFEEVAEQSYFGPMVDLLSKQNVRLVLVRVKRRAYLTAKPPQELETYVSALTAYLNKRGGFVIDFTNDERIVDADYADYSDHLTADGKRKFTQLLSDAYRALPL